MTKITTATGKEFDTDYTVEHEPSHSLYIRIIGEDFNTVRNVFSDEKETSELEYGGRKYVGFTKLDYIKQQSDAVKMRLMQWNQ